MVRYAPKAALALAFLKKSYNSIDVFVEDTGNHNMWLLLLRRLLPKRIKLTSVNMLGGRKAVVDACRLDQSTGGRKRLYIIDADFDLLLGKRKPALKHLYRIRAYCVENLLLNETALLGVGMVSQPMMNEAQVAQAVDYKGFVEAHAATLTPLFIAYAAAHDVAPEVATVGYSITNLFDATPQGPTLSREKTWARLRGVVREAVQVAGIRRYRAVRKAASARAAALGHDQIVSGKDYLFPLVSTRMRGMCAYRGGPEQLKTQLAAEFTASCEPWLAKRLRAIAA